jgi:hypothetical protein
MGVLQDLADQHGLTFAFGYDGNQKAWTFTCVRPTGDTQSCGPSPDLDMVLGMGEGMLQAAAQPPKA